MVVVMVVVMMMVLESHLLVLKLYDYWFVNHSLLLFTFMFLIITMTIAWSVSTICSKDCQRYVLKRCIWLCFLGFVMSTR